MNNYSEEQYDRAEKMAIEYIQENYVDVAEVNIETVDDSPMGGIDVRGTANDGEFTVAVNVNKDGSLRVGGVSRGEGFPDLKP